MRLRFSTHPGCWERHLQRQYHNQLFAHAPHLTQALIEAAQHKDEEERNTFRNAFQTLLQEVADLDTQVKVEVVLKLKTKIECLYEQCASLGGDFYAEKQGLHKLYDLIIQSILDHVTLDTHSQNKLKQEVIDQEQHFALLEYPLIAHLLHPQSPITQEDLIPTLLTEDEASLRAALNLFAIPQRQILYQEAEKLLTHLKNQGYSLPIAWQRLAIMEQLLNVVYEKNSHITR